MENDIPTIAISNNSTNLTFEINNVKNFEILFCKICKTLKISFFIQLDAKNERTNEITTTVAFNDNVNKTFNYYQPYSRCK